MKNQSGHLLSKENVMSETVRGVVCHELDCPNRRTEDDTFAVFLMREHGLTEEELERRANNVKYYDMLAGQ